MTYALTGLTAGVLNGIENEEMTKDANLFITAIPQADDTGAKIADLFGVTSTIRVSGKFVNGMGSKTPAQFITELRNLCTGAQTTKTFTSDVAGSISSCLVNTLRWRYEEGAPDCVFYDIELVIGDVLGE